MAKRIWKIQDIRQRINTNLFIFMITIITGALLLFIDPLFTLLLWFLAVMTNIDLRYWQTKEYIIEMKLREELKNTRKKSVREHIKKILQ